MNLKKRIYNLGGILIFYLVLIIGAYLIGLRFNHLNVGSNSNNNNINNVR